MPNIATINGIDEDDIATHNGVTASTILSKKGCTWEHLTAFGGGNQSATDLKTFFDTNFINSFAVNSPTAGGNLTLNGQNVGPYDYVLKRSDITLSSTPTSSDWFTTTKDTRSAIIGVAGNLTINSGAFIRPPDRKLFMAIYVDGDLTVNGNISMTARGANHSGGGTSGGATTAREIRLATGTFGGISNPVVPAAGSAGAVGTVDQNTAVGANYTTPGVGASAASGGGTGGGGAGGGGHIYDGTGSAVHTLGSGAAGTCFTSGSGGGGMYNNNMGNQTSGSASANGGAGGNSWINAQGFAGPGAGNPAGFYAGIGGWGNIPYTSTSWKVARDGGTSPHTTLPHNEAWNSGSTNMRGREAAFEGYANGTAGTLVIYVSGTLSGSGNIDSSGLRGGVDGGGGSGGGSITVFYNTDSSSITPRAPGQAGSAWNGFAGGLGGTGTARKLSGL